MVYPDPAIHLDRDEVVLFPFDNTSVPFRHSLQLSLVEARRHPDNPILRRGEAGQPDDELLVYYGTVIRVDGELRMWYVAGGREDRGKPLSWYRVPTVRVCYATSQDGIHWTKPNLGLVDYGGNTDNNLVALECEGAAEACLVWYEPDDPDPERRFKMVYEMVPPGTCHVAFSRDGLVWKKPTNNLLAHYSLEPSGLIKRHGCYYAIGQQGGFRKRLLVAHASYDFEHWTESCVLGFRRDEVGPLRPTLYGGRTGEQVHLGASLWDRGNVILGFYGQWHGPSPETNDRRYMSMDIGLVISHDAMHYHEPIPDFKIVPAVEEGWPSLTPGPRLTQGQGFEQMGDSTYFWYGTWGPGAGDGVRLAMWPRDRFGYYAVSPREVTEGQERDPDVTPHFISAPISLDHPAARVFVNADGLGEHCALKVEVLDEQFRKIAGYSGDDCIPIGTSGLRQPVVWRNKDALTGFDQPVRVQVSYTGLRPEDARVYAVYVAKD